MPAPPSSLGSYSVERELGRGGMGVVYLARDPRLDRPVAIKVLLGLNPDALARFEREAKLLASLSHPNIATVYGVESAGGQQLLVLEYIPGETLAARIARGPLPLSEALDVARQVALGVEAAHDGGVIHRDLKPGNVKVTPDGTVKVLDFGLAKNATASDVDLAHSPTLTYAPTSAGVILGTAPYMSPEQARGKIVDRRTDIWSFGCVLFECFSGRKAFDGETVSDTIAAILEREPDWSALPAQTPPRIRELVARCLVKDPKKRQRDIGDARLELEAAIASRDTSTTSTSAMPARVAGGRSRLVIAVGAAILGAAVATGVWRLMTPSAPPSTGPVRLSLTVPPTIDALAGGIMADGRTFVALGVPHTTDGPPPEGFSVYVRRLDANALEPLKGANDWTTFTASADGAWVAGAAFIAPGAVQRHLVKVAVDGSSPPVPIADWDPRWGSITWLESGDFLITTDGDRSVVRLPRGGGAPSPPIPLDTGSRSGRPSLYTALPQDRGVFMRVQTYGEQGFQENVWVLDLRTNKTHPVVENGGSPFYVRATGDIVFTRGDTVMAAPFSLDTLTVTGDVVALPTGIKVYGSKLNPYMALSDNGTLVFATGAPADLERQLVVVDPAGAVTPFGRERRNFGSVWSSQDGRLIATTVTGPTGTEEVWMSDRDRPFSRRVVTMANADCLSPKLSDDDRLIAFRRAAGDDSDGVYVQAVEGGEPPRLILKASRVETDIPTSWSPDGSAVLVRHIANDKNDDVQLLRVPVRADGKTGLSRVLRESPLYMGGGRISPDGRVITFDSQESGQPEVYIAPYSADGTIGRAVVVSHGVTANVGWSAGSRRFFYEDNDKLMYVTVQESPALSVSAPVIALDISKLRLDDYTVLPDGQLVGVRSEAGLNPSSFTVILNWFDELRARMNTRRKP